MTDIWIPHSFRSRPYASSHFARMVAWAAKEHPFYRKFCPDPAREVPVLGRGDFMSHNDLLLNGHPETGRTSGSTGVPVRVSWSPEKQRRDGEAVRLFRQLVGGPLSRIRIVSAREANPGDCWLDICSPLDEQLAFLRRELSGQRDVALVTYPTNAIQLAEALQEQGETLPQIARLVCYAESYDEEQEPLLQAAFPKARIWNNYSCSELGVVALRCPHEPDFMHAMAANVGVEILDANGLPVADGATGKLVLTDYWNTYSPFIRYDKGDMAVAGTCPCGKIPYLSFRRALGKVRGFLKDANGHKRIFANIGARLKHVDGLQQYQIIQQQLDRLTVRYVAGKNASTVELERRLAEELETFLGHRPQMDFCLEPVIERESNGKFYATKCMA